MAKKDTYLALLRRGVDETTAMTLADSGLKIGEIKKLDKEQLVQNYGLKDEIARSVLEVLQSGSTGKAKERYLSNVLSGPEKKPMDKIEEQRFKRQQKDILLELQEERERLKFAKVEQFRNQKIVMNRLGKTIELIVKLENNFDDESKEEQRSKIRDQLETRGLEAARDHELLELDCDVLVPAAIDNVITEDNATHIKAPLILEAANHPITPDADRILTERGITVLPDILVNAGGVIVSYFEWTQNIQGFHWEESRVNEELSKILIKAYREVRSRTVDEKITHRQASFELAVKRVARVVELRGFV